jgi:hypothetical protein
MLEINKHCGFSSKKELFGRVPELISTIS